MRKILVSAFSLLLLSACASGEKKSENDEGKERVAQAVTEMYTDYFSPETPSEEEEGEGELTGLGNMYKYVTEDFNANFCMCQSKCISTGEMFLDYDIWINAQDYQDLALDHVDVIDYTAEQATADVFFMNFGEMSQTRLMLTYDAEKQSWLVSDFVDPETGDRFTTSMEAFLEAPFTE